MQFRKLPESWAVKENRIRDAAAELEVYLAAVHNAPDAGKVRALLAQLKFGGAKN